MALLEAKGLHAQYGWTKVLHGIDFAVQEGGITTILGANGAGKTTTLRAVCGMVRTAGEIRFDAQRSEEHTSELQSQSNLVCRLLLEKKKKSHDKLNDEASWWSVAVRVCRLL